MPITKVPYLNLQETTIISSDTNIHSIMHIIISFLFSLTATICTLFEYKFSSKTYVTYGTTIPIIALNNISMSGVIGIIYIYINVIIL